MLPPPSNTLYLQPQPQQQRHIYQHFQPSHHREHVVIKNSISSISANQKMPLPQLADFAAQMVCFLWFGQIHNKSNGLRRCPVIVNFAPRPDFKKFCLDVLQATQVSQVVILLSLLYIDRLKRSNPSIRGAEGSEYRLLTVALMLANKFLDDNTYTNKTWSDVTSIPVHDINIMEIEFLSSLNWSLYVSEGQYSEWLEKLTEYVALKDRILASRNNNSIHQPKQLQQQSSSVLTTLTPPPSPMAMDFVLSPSSSALATATNNMMSAAAAAKRSAEQACLDSSSNSSSAKRTNVYGNYQSQQHHNSHITLPPPRHFYSTPVTMCTQTVPVPSQIQSQQSTSIFYNNFVPTNLFWYTTSAAKKVQSNLIQNTRSAIPYAFSISFPTTVA